MLAGRSDSAEFVSPPAMFENSGIWLKLLRGEVETDPEDIGEEGPMKAIGSKLEFVCASTGKGEYALGLGGLSSKAKRFEGRRAFAVGLIGAPPVSLSSIIMPSDIVPALISAISVGAVTMPLAKLKKGLDGMLWVNFGLAFCRKCRLLKAVASGNRLSGNG
jgi:hypothetical protein